MLNTYLMGKCLDKVYYPLLPVFNKYRALEKKFSKAEFSKISTFEDSIEPTKSQKRMQKQAEMIETMTLVDQIDDEIYEEQKKFKKEMEELIESVHTGYINEQHFNDDPKKYEEFLDEYIH